MHSAGSLAGAAVPGMVPIPLHRTLVSGQLDFFMEAGVQEGVFKEVEADLPFT